MASSPKRKETIKSTDSEITFRSTLSKIFTPEATWPDKDEFLDVIYWMRQILGIFLGLIWGVIPLKGIFGILIFFLINVGLIYVYYSTFQRVEDEEYGGSAEILKEGLMTSFSSFLVVWIVLYSSLYSDL
ncbi:uncharacterized protein RAB5IF homolog [Argonauta hians]